MLRSWRLSLNLTARHFTWKFVLNDRAVNIYFFQSEATEVVMMGLM